jgi:ribosomal protein S18 acetylase RimI-like enzyme
MMASIEIRRAEAADAAALSRFAARLFRATYGEDTPAADLEAYVVKAFRPDIQAAEIGDPEAAVFLATNGGTIAGYAYLVVPPSNADPGLLSRIYIDAAWRGQGLANRLLDAVVSECVPRGVERLQLTVYEKNARAIAFYNKVGFVPVGSTTFTVGEDVQTDIVMERATR